MTTKKKIKKRCKEFKRHFRIYLKNNHPAYIVDEEGNVYVFHRVTHSKTSGGRKNWEYKPNPIKGHNETMFIVKQEKRDFKGRFSLFEIELKDGVDVSYPEIKKVGRTQNHHNDERATITSDTGINGPGVNIKTKRNKKSKGKQNV